MKRSGCLILGQRTDLHVSRVVELLESKGLECIVFDEYRNNTTLYGDRKSPLTWDIFEEIKDFESLVVWPRFKPPWGADVPQLGHVTDLNAPAEKLYEERFWSEEWKSVLACIIYGIRRLMPYSHVVNYEGKARTAQSKALQLFVASRMGMSIPKTAITNDRSVIDRLFEERVLYKALSSEIFPKIGSVPVADLLIHDVLNSMTSFRQIGIFQERVEKRVELRVSVFGNDVVTAEIASQKHSVTSLDWRLGCSIPEMFHEIETPEVVRDFTSNFLDEFDLDTGMFDFAVNPSGEIIFFECNPSGQWLWLEDSGIKVAHRMAEMLEMLSNSLRDRKVSEMLNSNDCKEPQRA